ncbi:MAG: sulfur carrier protein ThiS [Deltaproteobacteria bacterium]|jgi:thiamine biosynthesis protein ThiS|nr:sulfur carrier protein ThiS [Deltaproteobacteria bacterium]
MWVIINGFKESIPEKASIAEVIHSRLEFEIHMIVELNHRFIHQKDYETTYLSEGDILELIHPAFGG